jgi:chromosome segregation ATPase
MLSDERYKEDEVVTARRSEIVEAENQHLLQEMEKFESEKRQREGDVEKFKKDIQRTQEKLKKHQADLAAVESDIIRLQRHQGKLD